MNFSAEISKEKIWLCIKCAGGEKKQTFQPKYILSGKYITQKWWDKGFPKYTETKGVHYQQTCLTKKF